METVRYQDVFVPGGFPHHTYNPRVDLQLESKIGEVRENLCKLVAVTGQTKSGKTVLARRVLPREETLWVDGGVVSAESDFWQVIIEQLDLFQVSSHESSTGGSSEISGSAKAGANFIFAKGEGEVGGKIGRESGSSDGTSQALSDRVTALKGLATAGIPLIVDDFHYLPKDLQGSIVRALKPLIFDGLPVVIIAIPHRRYDAIKVEREMTGRFYPVDIPMWTDAELRFIPEKGFGLLNHELSEETLTLLSTNAIGSPHLMQDFCRNICKLYDLKAAEERRSLEVGTQRLQDVFREVADTIGRPIFEKLARGPRQRTDRMQRELKDGGPVDIYELVLHALADLRPGLVSIEYEDLRSAIRNVSASQIPQLHEIARVLKHMSSIAATDQSSTPVIDFEEEEKKLHITDPFFAFYLRWGNLDA